MTSSASRQNATVGAKRQSGQTYRPAKLKKLMIPPRTVMAATAKFTIRLDGNKRWSVLGAQWART